MKKVLLSLSMLFFANSCFAAVGYVDYSVIYKNLPISQQYQKRIDTKATEVRSYNLQTQTLSKAQTTPEAKAKVIESRKTNLYKIEKEYIDLRYKQEAVVKEKTAAASEIVRAQKGLDMIVDKKSRIAGGVDCTQEVLRAIK